MNIKLNIAVCEKLGINYCIYNEEPCIEYPFDPEGPAHYFDSRCRCMWVAQRYSSEWDKGGPILEKLVRDGMNISIGHNMFICSKNNIITTADTLLEAAMLYYII